MVDGMGGGGGGPGSVVVRSWSDGSKQADREGMAHGVGTISNSGGVDVRTRATHGLPLAHVRWEDDVIVGVWPLGIAQHVVLVVEEEECVLWEPIDRRSPHGGAKGKDGEDVPYLEEVRGEG